MDVKINYEINLLLQDAPWSMNLHMDILETWMDMEHATCNMGMWDTLRQDTLLAHIAGTTKSFRI